MNGLLASNVRAHWSRYTATSVAIALATAFILVCLGLSGGFKAGFERSIADEVRGADIIGSVLDQEHVDDAVRSLEGDKRITAVQKRGKAHVHMHANGQDVYGVVQTLRTAPFTTHHVSTGQLPQKPGEVLIGESFAQASDLHVGDSLDVEVTIYPKSNSPETEVTTKNVKVTISGVTSSGAFSVNTLFAPASEMDQFAPEYPQLAIATDLSASEVKDIIGSASDGIDIKTADEYFNERVSDVTHQGVGFTIFLMVFPTIAAVTAMIVISTTFQVMLTQRQRELALLRAIGADRRQVRSLVVKETLAVGVLSSFIGVVLGVVISVIVNRLSGLTENLSESLHAISPLALAATFLSGVLITLIAGFAPARRASALAPMTALQPEDASPVRRRRVWLRSILTVLFVGAGVALIALSRSYFTNGTNPEGDAAGYAFLFALAGGALSFIGALFLFTMLASLLTAAFGRLFGSSSITASLAGENTARNPGRTGATVTALILGVTLVVTMMVGAASMQKTARTVLNESKPIDVYAELNTVADSGLGDKVAALDNISAVEVIDGAQVSILATVDGTKGDPVEAVVYRDMDLGKVALSEPVRPADGQIAVNGWLFSDGLSAVEVRVGQRTWELEPVLSRTAGYTVSAKTFDQIAAAAKDAGQTVGGRLIYAKLSDDATAALATKAGNSIGSLAPDAAVSLPSFERLSFEALVNGILYGMLAMLAVSVVVALVGVGNTLSLSVIERRRENALLRAIGMPVTGVRRMLMVEAILLAVVALIIGIALGIGYGILGVHSLSFGGDVQPIISIPWLQVLGVVVVTVMAAVLASILPGRRASKASPVEALAHA